MSTLLRWFGLINVIVALMTRLHRLHKINSSLWQLKLKFGGKECRDVVQYTLIAELKQQQV